MSALSESRKRRQLADITCARRDLLNYQTRLTSLGYTAEDAPRGMKATLSRLQKKLRKLESWEEAR